MGSEVVWNAEADRTQAVTLAGRAWRAAAARRRRARLCLGCGRRRPLFSYRGVVKADRDHTLCFECYRAEVNRLRARRQGSAAAGASMANPRPSPSKGVTDRAALRAEIATRRRRAQIAARHALDAPDIGQAAESLAS